MTDDGRIKEILNDISTTSVVFFALSIFEKGASFLVNIILANGLSTSGYGSYVFGKSFVNGLREVSVAGLDKSLLREEASVTQTEKFLLSITSVTIMSSVSAIIMYNVTVSITDYPSDLLYIFSISLVPLSISAISMSLLRNFEMGKLAASYQKLLFPGLIVLLSAISLALGYSTTIVALAFLVSACVFSLLGIASIISVIDGEFSANFSKLSSLFKGAGYIIVGDIGTMLYMQADFIIVGTILGGEHLAPYKIAALLAGLLSMPLAAVNQMFPTYASKLYENNNRRGLGRVYSIAVNICILVSLLMIAALIGGRRQLISLFSVKYTMVITPFVIILVGRVANNIVGPSGFLLITTRNERYTAFNQVVAGLLNVLSSLILVPIWGITGAAVGYSLSQIVLNSLRLIEVKFTLDLWPYSTTSIVCAIVGLASAVFSYLISNILNFLWMAITFIILSATLVLLAGTLYLKQKGF